MSDATWASQLAEAISSLAEVSELVAFPSRCDKVLEVASKQGLSAEDSRAHLKQLLASLPSWRLSPPPEFSTAFAQLQELCGFGPPALSDNAITSLLRVFPKYKDHTNDWLGFALATKRLAIVAELLALDFITDDDVARQAEEDPIAFCTSRVPEVISSDSKTWRPAKILDAFFAQTATATSSETIARLVKGVIRCYSASTSRKTDTRIIEFLSSATPAVVAKFLDETFRRPAEGARLASSLQETLRNTKSRSKRESAARIAKMLAERALEVIEAGSSPGAETAGLALAYLQLALQEEAAVKGSTKSSDTLLTRTQATRLLQSIASHAEAKAPSGNTVALVSGYDIAMTFGALKTAAQRLTPIPTASGQTAVSSAHEAGMRKILGDFARLTTIADDPHARDDALRVILFNHGVREFGTVGEELAFDSAVHETRDAGIFPGDPVRLVRPGQEISATGARHILVKACVTSIPNAST